MNLFLNKSFEFNDIFISHLSPPGGYLQHQVTFKRWFALFWLLL